MSIANQNSKQKKATRVVGTGTHVYSEFDDEIINFSHQLGIRGELFGRVPPLCICQIDWPFAKLTPQQLFVPHHHSNCHISPRHWKLHRKLQYHNVCAFIPLHVAIKCRDSCTRVPICIVYPHIRLAQNCQIIFTLNLNVREKLTGFFFAN